MDERRELAPAERVACYRAYADQAIASAKGALTEEIKLGYLKMAEDWLKLADDLEALYGKVSVTATSELASRPGKD